MSNTLSGLAKLGHRVSDEMQRALLIAVKRCAAIENCYDVQQISNTQWALAELQWPVTGALRAPLSSVACSLVHEMTEQGVANTLWAQAWFSVATGEALDFDPSSLFARSAELLKSMNALGKRQVRSAVLMPMRSTSTCLVYLVLHARV